MQRPIAPLFYPRVRQRLAATAASGGGERAEPRFEIGGRPGDAGCFLIGAARLQHPNIVVERTVTMSPSGSPSTMPHGIEQEGFLVRLKTYI